MNAPIAEDIKKFDVFEVFACTLLRPMENEDEDDILPAGTDVFGSQTPGGVVYLSASGKVGARLQGPVFCSTAMAGVDFTADELTLARLELGTGYVADPTQQGLWRPGP